MKRTYYFADKEDHQLFREFVRDCGALVVPWSIGPGVDVDAQDFSTEALCYISLKRADELRRRELFPDRISFGDNPVIRWNRAYFRSPYLIAGDIELSEFDEVEARVMQVPYEEALAIGALYKKLSAFIRSKWTNIERDGFYFGPSAAQRYRAGGVEAASFMPGTVQEVVIEVPSEEPSN